MLIKGTTYKGKHIEQPIVISKDFEYDVSFVDIIGEHHSVLNLKQNGAASAVLNALRMNDLTLNDIEKTSIRIFRHGTYTMLQPKKEKGDDGITRVIGIEMLQKVVANMYRVLKDGKIVEEKLTVEKWMPFSKYNKIRNLEERYKKIAKEVAMLNAANKRALLKKKFAK